MTKSYCEVCGAELRQEWGKTDQSYREDGVRRKRSSINIWANGEGDAGREYQFGEVCGKCISAVVNTLEIRKLPEERT